MDSAEKTKTAEPKKLNLKPFGALSSVVIIYFGAQFIGSLLVLIYPLIQGWNDRTITTWFKSSVLAQFWLVLSVEAVTLGLLFWLLKWRKITLGQLGLIKPRLKDLAYTAAGAVLYIIAVIAATGLAQRLFPALDFEQKQQLGFESARQGPELFLVLISLVLLPAFIEEIIMRGFLYGVLRQHWRKWLAAVVTSLVFALAHLQFSSGAPLLWAAGIDTFVLSLVLIGIREKSGSLWPAIWLHLLKNSVAFSAVFILSQ